ncbi:ABC transporter permease [Xylanimonas protaetiae]|uniref:Transport permease protein n=1 Tax=Xylanimonas protaetiae TaxID=2509457 RepID=A0A4V0YFU3_9MICO|nr:ABC transporter permease [Xylanimonas protaetiae]QAY68911.1 ABC transporter permease [Xylanimonas protaetiae]
MTTEVPDRAAALALEPMRPAGPRKGFVGGTIASIKDVVAHRELLDLLVRRELKARYKDSALGFLWSLARPLAMLLIYYVVLGQFLGQARGLPGFAVFIYSSLTAWGFFSEAVSAATGSVVNNAGLVKKVYMPREVFPLAAIGSAAFNFAVQLVVLFAAVTFFGEFPTGARWIYFPLSLVVLFAWGTAIGLILAAVNVYLRDVQYLVEIAIMIFFWASPIVYSWTFVQSSLQGWVSEPVARLLMNIYLSNPATTAVLGFQRTFWVAGDGTPDNPLPQVSHLGLRLTIVAVVGIIFLWVAQRIFARLQANLAQEL